MKILFIGDVVGSPGRKMVQDYVKRLKAQHKPTLTVINGENAAAGKGITEKIYKGFLDAGAQAVTLGNHAWANRDIFEFIDRAKWLVRPANYPEGTPGVGMVFTQVNQIEIAVINLMGRTFLPANDCPFRKADELIEEARKRTPYIFVDFHAEATSEKVAMGWYLDGRVTAVVGTHTHIQTSDERILPKGTAYITDVGMTGPYDGILGVEREPVLHKFLTNMPARFELASGREQLSGVVVEVNAKTGQSTSIKRILINDDHPYLEL